MEAYEHQQQDTRGTLARFVLHPKKDAEASLKAGRLICRDVVYCEIRVAGSRDIVRAPATEQDKRNYPKEWAAYISNQDQEAVSGTPLASLPGISASLVEEARYLHLRTVEQLAEISDAAVSNLGMGWGQLRQRARDYIEQAKGMAPLEEARAENARLQAQIDAQQRQMDALQRQMEELTRPAVEAKQEQPRTQRR